MQIILLLPLAIAALCLWIYAERRLGLTARVAAGIAFLVLTGLICYFLAGIIPRYESTFHRSSLRLAGELTAKGETQRVLQAVQAYNRVASTGTTYCASMEMWYILNHGPRQ
jgi:hypothetical protein